MSTGSGAGSRATVRRRSSLPRHTRRSACVSSPTRSRPTSTTSSRRSSRRSRRQASTSPSGCSARADRARPRSTTRTSARHPERSSACSDSRRCTSTQAGRSLSPRASSRSSGCRSSSLGFTQPNDLAHAPNEWFDLDNYERAIRTIAVDVRRDRCIWTRPDSRRKGCGTPAKRAGLAQYGWVIRPDPGATLKSPHERQERRPPGRIRPRDH